MEKKAKKVVIGDSRIIIDEKEIKTNRPDAAVWMQNGKVDKKESDIVAIDNKSEIHLDAARIAESVHPYVGGNRPDGVALVNNGETAN